MASLTKGSLTPAPDGTITAFTIPETLVFCAGITRNGISQDILPSGTPVVGEVVVSGTSVTFPVSPNAPKTGDKLRYWGEK